MFKIETKSLIKALSACLILFPCMLWILGKYAVDGIPIEKMQGIDFFVFYCISDMINNGYAAKITIPDQFQEMLRTYGYAGIWHWLYPPTLMLALGWIHKFPFFLSLGIYIFGQTLLFYFACRNYLAKNFWELMAFMGIPCFSIALGWGQISIVIASFYILGFRNIGRRPMLAGIFFGIAATKPSMVIFLPILLLVNRKFKTFLAMVVTVIFLAGLSAAVFGFEVWVNYLTVNIPSLKFYLSALREVHFHMPTIYAAWLMLKIDGAYLNYVEIIIMLAAAVLTLWISRQGNVEIWQVVIIGLLTITALPYAYGYDFLIVIPFFISWFIRRFPKTNLLLLVIFLCGYSLDILTLVLDKNHFPIMPLIMTGLAIFVYRNRSLQVTDEEKPIVA